MVFNLWLFVTHESEPEKNWRSIWYHLRESLHLWTSDCIILLSSITDKTPSLLSRKCRASKIDGLNEAIRFGTAVSDVTQSSTYLFVFWVSDLCMQEIWKWINSKISATGDLEQRRPKESIKVKSFVGTYDCSFINKIVLLSSKLITRLSKLKLNHGLLTDFNFFSPFCVHLSTFFHYVG